MNKFYLIIYMLTALSTFGLAQTSSIEHNSLSQTFLENTMPPLEIVIDQEEGKYFTHALQEGETIYGIAKQYMVKPARILELNAIDDASDIDISTTLKIPLNTDILKDSKSGSDRTVIYKVQPKDNIYRISKVYFDQDMETFMRMNKLSSLNLSIGQEFIVGYMASTHSDQHTDVSTIVTDTFSTQSDITIENELVNAPNEIMNKNELFSDSIADLKETLNIEPINKNLRQTRGIAIWNRNSKDQDNMFALHRSAKIGSIVEIYNPLLKRKAFAKVVAKIPSGVYPRDVSIILSKRVVDALGALDGRFQVEMKFYE